MINNNTKLKYIAACKLPTEYGFFTIHGFEDSDTKQEHIALSMGDIGDQKPVLTRIHSECLTGDALFSQRCDCGPQLKAAMKAVHKEGRGLIIYLRQEGRGIGLINKIRAYKLQDSGLDTVEANLALNLPIDAREYTFVKDICDYLHVHSINLMTNNPQKINSLNEIGIQVVNRVPLHVGQNAFNEQYLHTKFEKMGHFDH